MSQPTLKARFDFQVLIPAVVCLAALLPFITKAFHIDDPLFLWTAKQILVNPLDFFGFSVNWWGIERPMAGASFFNPPLNSYYIALVASIFGWGEVALHTAFLIPALGVAIGTYYLAKELCPHPVLAALSGIVTPVFMVSSTNVMCDTLMLAFWVWSIVFWIQGMKEKKGRKLLLGGVLIAACALTKYYGMVLIGLMFVYSLLKTRKVGSWVFYLLIPVIALVCYQWWTYELYGKGLITDASDYAVEIKSRDSADLISNLLTTLSFTGGSIITLLFFMPLLWPRLYLIGAFLAAILLIFGLASLEKIAGFSIQDVQGIRWSFVFQFGVMILAGFHLLALAGFDCLKSRDSDSILLFLWVLGTFVFAGFLNWSITARTILPMVPVAGILIVRQLFRFKGEQAARVKDFKIYFPVLFAGIVAFTVAWADFTLANTARSAVQHLDQVVKDRTNRNIWFQGHWGFQYYMELAHARAVDFNRSQINQGDIVVVPANNTNLKTMRDQIVEMKEYLEFMPFSWLTTLERNLGAGFYSSIWGPLPFAFGTVQPELFYLFQADWTVGSNQNQPDLSRTAVFDVESSYKALGSADAATQFALGHEAMDKQEFERAVAYYQEAVQINPNYVEAHNSLAVAYTFLGRLEEAVASYEQALKIRPDYIHARSNMEIVKKILSQSQDEREVFVRSLKHKVQA